MQPIKKNKPHSAEVNSYLQSQLAHLWPAIASIGALQKACARALPQLFLYCVVLHLEKEALILGAPNTALASKLRQQLPKLQTALQKSGWQIIEIRIKVQTFRTLIAEPVSKEIQLSDTAIQSFAALEKNLAQSQHNDDLLGALRTLLERHK